MVQLFLDTYVNEKSIINSLQKTKYFGWSKFAVDSQRWNTDPFDALNTPTFHWSQLARQSWNFFRRSMRPQNRNHLKPLESSAVSSQPHTLTFGLTPGLDLTWARSCWWDLVMRMWVAIGDKWNKSYTPLLTQAASLLDCKVTISKIFYMYINTHKWLLPCITQQKWKFTHLSDHHSHPCHCPWKNEGRSGK